MAIVTEGLRRDNQNPLQYFDQIKILHFYNFSPYGAETKKDFLGAIKFKSAWDLYERLVQVKPDIIQGPEPYGSKKMFSYCIASYFAAKKLHIPLIFPFWENRPAKKRFNFFQRVIVNWFAKKYLNFAQLIIYLNQGALKNIKALGIKDESKLVKFLWGTYGVDTNEFYPRESNKSTGFHDKVILYVGRLDYEKGIKYLLLAFLKVHKRFPNAKLIFIGDGNQASFIKDFRIKYKLENKIILKGLIANRDLPIYFQHATIFASPSITIDKWEEQVGMTNLQAMSSGVPVVSTISGGIPEYVPNKIAGLLVPERDPDRLAGAMLSLLDNDKLRTRISRQARVYALENYDAKDNVLKAQKLVLDLLKNINKNE